MKDLTQTIEAIREAVDDLGLPAFSRLAELPYTTVVHWREKDFQPPDALATFEKMAAAAVKHRAAKDTPPAVKGRSRSAPAA